MDFANERYVRVYTRDTATWKLLPWQGRALLPLILRKLDRAGVADLGEAETPAEAVAALVDLPEEVCAVGLPALLKRGVLVLQGGRLWAPKFVEAQECASTPAQRQRESRGRARELGALEGHAPPIPPLLEAAPQPPVTIRDEVVTKRDDLSRAVTDGHATSQVVTPCLAVPSLAVPSLSSPLPPSAEKSFSADADPGKPAELTGPAALAILAKAAGPRLVLHPPGRPYASETGLAPDDETSWCYAWHKLREAWGEADLKALGEEIAAGRLWAHLKRGVSAAYLVKNLTDGLQQAAAPAPTPPPPPDPRPPPRPHTKTTPQRIGVTMQAQPEDPARAAEQLQRGKALLARLGVKLPPEAVEAMGGEEAGHAG